MRVVVVGAGIVGASAAFHLSDRGADVVVVDGARRVAATQAAAGIICPWPTAHPDGDYVERYVESAHGIGPIVDRLAELGEARDRQKTWEKTHVLVRGRPCDPPA